MTTFILIVFVLCLLGLFGLFLLFFAGCDNGREAKILLGVSSVFLASAFFVAIYATYLNCACACGCCSP